MQKGIREAFVKRLCERLDMAVIGDPMDEETSFGPMVSEAQRKIVLGYIEKGGVKSKGAKESGQRWMKSFHSFRHVAIDNLRSNKTLPSGEYILESHIALVMGHTGKKLETANYGKDRSQLMLRKAVIEAIDYPFMQFDKIKWS